MTLTEQVVQFRLTGRGLEAIKHQIGVHAYALAGRKSRQADDAGDFFLFMQPRILGIVTKFRYLGKPFENWMWVCLKWYFLIFKNQQHHHRGYLAYCENPEFIHLALEQPPLYQASGEPTAADQAQPADRKPTAEAPASVEPDIDIPQKLGLGAAQYAGTAAGVAGRLVQVRNRVMLLVMKCACLLDDTDVIDICRAVDADPTATMDAVRQLRACVERRKHRYNRLVDRRNQAYLAALAQQIAAHDNEDPAKVAQHQAVATAALNRLRLLTERVRRYRLEPRNHDIAAVINRPKGSVDSLLYYTRTTVRRSRSRVRREVVRPLADSQ